MIVVSVKLHSGITGRIRDLGTVVITNNGKSTDYHRGDYDVAQLRAGNRGRMRSTCRRGHVKNHARLARPIWSLVARALKSLGHS